MAVKSAIVNVMEGAARKAARGLVRDFGEVEQLQVSRKGPADFVSAADLRAEEVLKRELSRARPDYALLLEESGGAEGADARRRWIVDPLDGTTNFLHGLPHFAISIAFEEDGELAAGIIYEPLRDELFWAEKGRGAWLNDRRIRVSGRTDLAASLFATGIPFKGLPNHDRFLQTLGAVMPLVAGVRRYGSAALDLAYVAAGRYDGFWEFGLNPWDVAAGVLLVRESGGFVTEIGGRAYRLGAPHILAANPTLHAAFDKILRTAARES
ncbi:MAG: inositol monophosphatase family protein [Alphaproteobacteria bacterium]|nr:inositol monophosphatase family protein [Alphaproteobacteria bacterium]